MLATFEVGLTCERLFCTIGCNLVCQLEVSMDIFGARTLKHDYKRHQQMWMLAIKLTKLAETRRNDPPLAYVQAWDADRFQGMVTR